MKKKSLFLYCYVWSVCEQGHAAAVKMGVMPLVWSRRKPPVKHPAQEQTFPSVAGIMF